MLKDGPLVLKLCPGCIHCKRKTRLVTRASTSGTYHSYVSF
uniref:Uncharacterized protein n=1 Tax=Anguilla anguilla TaxID=7936 RepID=A0A0E9SNL3_ANGAN